MALRESATVTIVGSGVSGLTTALLLRSCGIDTVVLEKQPRSHVEERQRAGLVEYRAVRMFEQRGLGQVLRGFPGSGFLEVRVDGEPHLLADRLPETEGANSAIPQQALVRGLIAALVADGGDVRFEAADVALHDLDGDRPLVTYTDADGEPHEIECDLIAGCDGDRGVSAASIPADAGAVYEHDYGISWLAILADAQGPKYPLMSVSERGYAAHYARGPRASRFYLQVPAADSAADWPPRRIWTELKHRLHQPDLPDGPVSSTEIISLRSSVREPMSYGRLYLLGDAAHIISPMGAKGMNLALFDAEVFSAAVRDFILGGDESGLRGYSGTCLARTWRYQEFSDWLTDMMHGACEAPAGGVSYRKRIMRARLDRLLSSETIGRYYAEMFSGLG